MVKCTFSLCGGFVASVAMATMPAPLHAQLGYDRLLVVAVIFPRVFLLVVTLREQWGCEVWIEDNPSFLDTMEDIKDVTPSSFFISSLLSMLVTWMVCLSYNVRNLCPWWLGRGWIYHWLAQWWRPFAHKPRVLRSNPRRVQLKRMLLSLRIAAKYGNIGILGRFHGAHTWGWRCIFIKPSPHFLVSHLV